MILLKMDGRGRLEANWEEIAELAEKYDRGCRSEEAHQSKIISLIFEKGYEDAMKDLEQVNQRTLLLITHTGGHA